MSRGRWAGVAVAVLLAGLAVLLVVTDSGPGATPATGRDLPVGARAAFGERGFRVTGPAGLQVAAGCLLAAETAEQRGTGLMGVTDLGGYDGMVFLFDEETTSGFFMKDTPMPLSIAWFGDDGRFVSSVDMEPCPKGTDSCPTYSPTGPYRVALEAPKGGLPLLGIGPGSRLALTPRCN